MDTIWTETRLAEPGRTHDFRTRYQREYARLIHSAAFRRLQNKTQILGLGESDFYRTRLTHSLEVMQIGEGLVKSLQHTHEGHPALAALPDIELIQAVCLAHDIGHPPFGHSGEVALNYCMRAFGGFEGNGQTLRILSKLEPYTERSGINPSRRLLLGILKYPAPYSRTVRESDYGPPGPDGIHFKADDHTPPKCYLDTEQDVIDWLLAPFERSDRERFTEVREGKRHCHTVHKAFDTSIMDLADDISYGVHDLEDGIALHLVTRDVWAREAAHVPDKYRKTYSELGEDLFSEQPYRRKSAIGSLVNLFMTTAVVNEKDFNEPILRYTVGHEEAEKAFLGLLKEIVFTQVIKNTNVQLLEYKGQVVITTLFRTIYSDPGRFLPAEFKNRFEECMHDVDRARLVCDYIAGMADPYAARLYLKITQPGAGSIFEQL